MKENIVWLDVDELWWHMKVSFIAAKWPEMEDLERKLSFIDW